MTEDIHKIIGFCPCCFASEHDGSWGGGVYGDYCTNCGAGGMVSMPIWAVNSIRQNASWVGSRYYPSTQDHERHEELMALRALPEVFPGRTAERWESKYDPSIPPSWTVTQRMSDRKTTSVSISMDRAKTAEEALEAARYNLPYIPESKVTVDSKGVGVFQMIQHNLDKGN